MAQGFIFLDFDGVLNSLEFLWREEVPEAGDAVDELNPESVQRLNRLLEHTGAALVISSSWRRSFSQDELQALLASYGCTGKVVGVTPVLAASRGDEIAHWLRANAPDERFIILDDTNDMGSLLHRLVQVDMVRGLQDHDIEQAIQLFSSWP